MFLKNAAGIYEPAYFIIRIDSDEAPEELLERNTSTFVHEYIHLLQDLTLPYCMRENIVRLETFFLQIKSAKLQGELHLPSRYSDESVELCRKLAEVTWGGNSFHSDVEGIDQIDLTEESVEGRDYRLQKYTLSSGGVRDYHLGARDLLEYIASKIESRHFPGQAKPPDLPYRTVDLVLEHEGLMYLTEVKRIALAEYCLMNDNPARRLMVMIADIKKGLFAGKDRGDDNGFVTHLLNLDWQPNGAPARSMAQKLIDRYAELNRTLREQFPAESFPAIYDWLDGALQYAQRALAGRSLFAALFEMETVQFRAAISDLLSQFGVPLVVNRHGSLGTSLGGTADKDQFIQLLLAYEFAEYINGEETTCPLYERCESDSPDLIDQDDCIEAPFRRALRGELCPFGNFVKANGLSQVRWYKGDRMIPSWPPVPYGKDVGP